jgi:branched-subunit amino acid ABC-type transport system permease component
VVIGGTLGKAPGALVGAVVFGGIGTQVCPSGNSQWPPPAPLGGGDDPTSIFQ